MKAVKMFGLAVLAALMAMAFVGASSAMAESTALCATDPEPCEAVTHVHEESVGKAKLVTSLGTTECNVLYLGDVKSAGSPLVLSGGFTYTNCVLGGTSCTATEENGPSEIKVLREGHETSKVTGEGLVHLVCKNAGIDCSYNGTGLVGTGKGPLLSTQANGEVTLIGQITTKEVGGFLCPKESKLTITTTPLEKTYIKSGLHYCVEYARANTGYYLDSECTTKDTTRAGKFMLVVGPTGKKVGDVVCVDLLELVGLYKDSACTSDDSTNKSLYEKATITKVQ
jgi:hypothetical protein